MTIEVGAFEAKNKLSQLLDEVERGQRVCITRRGKPIAMLCKVEADTIGALEPMSVLHRLQQLRRSAQRGPETLKSLIDAGRR